MGPQPTLEYCALSDIGRRRATNQDALAILPAENSGDYRRRGWLFLVADGMGAHAAGETASRLASEQVPLHYEKTAARSPPWALKSSILHANQEIHTRGEHSADFRGMGTTCSVLAIVPRGALVGQVGDSRVYRVRGETIEQLSRDHSLAWEVEANRAAAGSHAAQHPVLQNPPKNIITRSLGPHSNVDVDLEGPFPIAADDVFVLCSDGLSGQVADDELGCLAGLLTPREAAAALLGLALVRGGPDNVTLIVAKAGRREQSEAATNAQPWPLSGDQARPRDGAQPLPVKMMILAAVGILGGLILNPWGDLMKEGGVLDGFLHGLAPAIGMALTGLMMLFALGGIIGTAAAFFQHDEEELFLPAGRKLGAGPYRTNPCPPTRELVEGIVASVESAADGLSDEERRRALDLVAAARREAGAGDLTAALAEAARGIAVYRRAIEAARTSDTLPADGP